MEVGRRHIVTAARFEAAQRRAAEATRRLTAAVERLEGALEDEAEAAGGWRELVSGIPERDRRHRSDPIPPGAERRRAT